MTLIDVVKHALASRKPVMAVGEASAAGEVACLERTRILLTPMRQLIRHVRLEEKILSVATVEDGVPETNIWNKREHLIAVAR